VICTPLDAGIGTVGGATLALQNGKRFRTDRNRRMRLDRAAVSRQWRKMHASRRLAFLNGCCVKQLLKA
jgi:hypothetical protein